MCACALVFPLLSTLPAFAGHYNSVYTYNGSSSPGLYDPSTSTYVTDWTTVGNSFGTTDSFDHSGKSANATLGGTVTATFTWVPDAAEDAPPDEVWVSEAARVDWWLNWVSCDYSDEDGAEYPAQDYTVDGSADNGLGGEYVPYGNGYGDGGYCLTSSKLTKVGGGASFTRSCTLSATGIGSGGSAWYGNVSVSGSYSVHIYATPYNFKIYEVNNHSDDNSGILDFTYTWKSTSGDPADLADVSVYEHVDYPGETPRCVLPFPFYGSPPNPVDAFLNPIEQYYVSNGSDCVLYDTHSTYNPSPGTGGFTATQEYRWHKPGIHRPTVDPVSVMSPSFYTVMDCDGASHSIVRSVQAQPPYNNRYLYTITKQGYTATRSYQ